MRLPWQKQANGAGSSLIHTGCQVRRWEIHIIEDKFAQIWNINTPHLMLRVFCRMPCRRECRRQDYGNKYTSIQMRLRTYGIWKLCEQTRRVTLTTSIWIPRVTGKDMPDAGRHSDPGGEARTLTISTPPGQLLTNTSADQPAPVLDNWCRKQPFKDTYKAKDEVAGIIVRPPTGTGRT